jgi:hypothetical protein
MATAALAVPVALMFQWAPTEPHPVVASAKRAEAAGWRGALTTPLQRWLIVAGFFEYLLSGVVVSTTAVFVAERLGADTGIAWLGIGVATLTGMLHGVRWITDLALGPAVGALSDRIGQATTAGGVTVILCGAIVGALTLPPGLAILCLFGVLLADGALHIVMSAAASGVALSTTRPHVFVGVFTTTTDAGSALGPLVAYSLVTVTGLTVVYGVLAALLLAAVLQYWRYGRALAA